MFLRKNGFKIYVFKSINFIFVDQKRFKPYWSNAKFIYFTFESAKDIENAKGIILTTDREIEKAKFANASNVLEISTQKAI